MQFVPIFQQAWPIKPQFQAIWNNWVLSQLKLAMILNGKLAVFFMICGWQHTQDRDLNNTFAIHCNLFQVVNKLDNSNLFEIIGYKGKISHDFVMAIGRFNHDWGLTTYLRILLGQDKWENEASC